MKAQDIVREVISVSGMSQAGVSKNVGKTRNYVNALVTQADATGGSLGCDTLAAMLDVCGYALVALPRPDVPDSALVIDPPRKDA